MFGDIDLDKHRAWCVRVCEEAGARAVHPLWKMDRLDVVREFLDAARQGSSTPWRRQDRCSAARCA